MEGDAPRLDMHGRYNISVIGSMIAWYAQHFIHSFFTVISFISFSLEDLDSHLPEEDFNGLSASSQVETVPCTFSIAGKKKHGTCCCFGGVLATSSSTCEASN